MKRVLALCLLCITLDSYAQTIFISKNESHQAIKVYVTTTPARADLFVYRVSYPNQATNNSGNWFFSKNELRADKSIFFVGCSERADLIIYFVTSRAQAGWRHQNKKFITE